MTDVTDTGNYQELRNAAMWVMLHWDRDQSQHHSLPALRRALGFPGEPPTPEEAHARVSAYCDELISPVEDHSPTERSVAKGTTRHTDRCRVGGCSNSREWELAKDRELDELTDDQLVYLDKSIAVTMEERGWIRQPGGSWRLDV